MAARFLKREDEQQSRGELCGASVFSVGARHQRWRWQSFRCKFPPVKHLRCDEFQGTGGQASQTGVTLIAKGLSLTLRRIRRVAS